MSNTNSAALTLEALQIEGFRRNNEVRERDVCRTTLSHHISGPRVTVAQFDSEPNLLDVAFAYSVPCRSDADELSTRRDADLIGQDHPFVKVYVENLGSKTRVELSLTHQLPLLEDERRAIVTIYLADFIAAVDEVVSSAAELLSQEAA